MLTILVVEDDTEINKLIRDYLVSQNYTVITAFDGLQALSHIQSRKDIALVLLDLMLPFQSGDRILKRLREYSDIPVIIVSAKDTVQTKIDTIRMGADDYITKPFDLDELSARIEAVLRRSGKYKNEESTMLGFRDISLDTKEKVAFFSGHRLDITAKEYAILELMMKYPTKLFSKANLFESVWNEEYLGDENTVKVHISNLRNKIKEYTPDEYIETVWGMGYRLKG